MTQIRSGPAHAGSSGTGIGTIGLLAAFRSERLSYVLLLCACLTLQSAFPAVAALLARDRDAAVAFILCEGGRYRGSPDGLAAGHACPAGACAMAGCAAGLPAASADLSFARPRGAAAVVAPHAIVLPHPPAAVTIRGPPRHP